MYAESRIIIFLDEMRPEGKCFETVFMVCLRSAQAKFF